MKDTSAPDQDEVLLEAARWIVRVEEGDFSPKEAEAFKAWRKADVRHNQAYVDLKQLWDDIPATSLGAGVAPAATNDDEKGPMPRKRHWGRWAVGSLVGAAAAVFVAVLIPQTVNSPAEHYSTDLAQISEIGLSDGSVATLGPKSTVKVTYSSDERRLELSSGEAYFEVAKAPERPFIVDAGNSIVRVVGTKFNVNRGENSVRIAVLEGIVQVRGRPRGAFAPSHETLHKGDQAQIVTSPGGYTRIFKSTNAGEFDKLGFSAAAWREGWLVYEDAKLSDIVADLNRYYAPGITLAPPALGETRITASFKATRIPEFVNSIDKLFPVTVGKSSDGSFVLRPAH